MAKKIVVPGEGIGVIEEYTPIGLTYEYNGHIRSMIVGKVTTNKTERSIEVMGKGLSSPFPLENSIVEGIVENTSNAGGIVRIYSINGKLVSSDLTGIIRSREKQEDLYKLGDLVRARVTSLSNRIIWLDIGDLHSGVVKTRCSICGGEVTSVPPNRVKCLICGNVERRKLLGYKLQVNSRFGKGERIRNNKFVKNIRRMRRYKRIDY